MNADIVPQFDEVSDFDLTPPEFFQCDVDDPFSPVHFPDHPGFGAPSAVGIPLRTMPGPVGLASEDFSAEKMFLLKSTNHLTRFLKIV